MGETVKHTFVVLAYRESPYLEACLKSVLHQTLPGSIVIATSTPNDFIRGLADRYGIPVKINPKGGNIGRDWNFGLGCADTPYVTLAHQDDLYLPRYTERCLAAAHRHKTANPLIVFTNSITYHDDKPVVFPFKNILRSWLIGPFHLVRCIASPTVKRFILLFSNSISCPGVCYVRPQLTSFQFDNAPKYVLDWKAWYDMSLMDGAFVYVPEALFIHREHAKSATATCSIEELQREESALLCKMWGNTWMPRIITRLLRLAK